MKTPQEIAKEQAEVMMAFADGAEIEFTHCGENEWESIRKPSWDWHEYEYRKKPEPPKAEVAPGEWYWDESTNDIVTNSDVIGDTICCPPADWSESFEHWPANRHLLAAAKDLRDALRAVLTMKKASLPLDQWPTEVVENANKALLKAKGESYE